MSTLRQVKAAAKKLNATVEDEKCGDCHCCRVEAPHRFRWADGGVHELVDETHRPWKPDYVDILARMSHGLEPCTTIDCEWCSNKEDEND